LRGSDEALISTLGILTLIDRGGVIARLGERVDLGTSAVSAVSPVRDMLAFLGNGLVEVSEGRSLELLLEQVCLGPLERPSQYRTGIASGHRSSAVKTIGGEGWEGLEAVEWDKARVAAISDGESDRRIG